MRTSELTALPLAERLQTMEALWASLDNSVDQASALPDWHEGIVQERLLRLREGSESVSDLQDGFNNIARSIAARQARASTPE